jgi:TonB family protein
MSRSASATYTTEGVPSYQLRSDLAIYCLPRASYDETRRLAWANSVCLLFLLVAFVGLRQPVFVIREPEPPPAFIPVELPALPPEQERPPEEEPEEEAEELIDDLVEVPMVAPVVVAAAQDVSFAVPVEGFTVTVADGRFVPPPPSIIPKAPPTNNIPRLEFRNIRFGGKEFRRQPKPNYPSELQRNRISGSVELLITVGPDGIPTKVEMGKASGSPALDRYVSDEVTEFIRRQWRAEPTEGTSYYRLPLSFVPF